MRSPFVFVVPLFVASVAIGCGGATTSDLFNDASTGSDASTGNDSSPGNDGAPGKDARPDSPPPADCKNLINDVANARDKARECSTVSAEPQCSKTVQDLCCPISVTDLTRKEVVEFVNAVAAVKKAGCQVPCPAIPCAPTPSNKCDSQTAHCL